MTQTDEYWWAQSDASNICDQLFPMNDFGTASYANNPIFSSWFRNTLIYYGNVIEPSMYDTSLIFKGKQGELVQMLVPISRSLIRTIVQTVSKQKLNFRCVADASMGNIMETMRLGNAVTRDVVKREQVDLKYAISVENGLVTGMSYLYVRWRTDKGQYFARDLDGIMHYKGDVKVSVPNVWDVTFDQSIPDPNDWQWVQVREIHNRWDLIAQRPDLKREILSLSSVRQNQGWFNLQASKSASDDDYVYIYNAYHIPTPALPEGRYIAYGSSDCVLFDGPNFYKCLPVYPSVPETIPNTCLGYPFYSNLLPLQEIFDSVISSNATNSNMFGVQTVVAPRGANINPMSIMGMNFVQYTPMPNVPGGGKPEALQLNASSADSYKFMDKLQALMGEISQVNSALRGEPPPQVSSGAAIATLTTTALDTINATAKSSRAMLKQAMLGAIKCYQIFASVERSVTMGTAGNQSTQLNFKGKDLDGLRDIDLQEVNPMMQALSGRIEIAEKAMNTGLITNLKGYFAVLEGAEPEELYKNELSQEDLVNRENQALLNGEEVEAYNIDDHPYHMMMHSIPLNDPKVRANKELAGRYMAHILKHYELSGEADPMFMAMVRTGKMPEQPMLPPGGGGGQQQPEAEAAEGGGQQMEAPEGEGLPEELPSQPAKPAQDLLARSAMGA